MHLIMNAVVIMHLRTIFDVRNLYSENEILCIKSSNNDHMQDIFMVFASCRKKIGFQIKEIIQECTTNKFLY